MSDIRPVPSESSENWRQVSEAASIALQHGVDPDMLRRALTRNGNGAASGPLGTLLDLLAEEGA
jgi:hypothetical protein